MLVNVQIAVFENPAILGIAPNCTLDKRQAYVYQNIVFLPGILPAFPGCGADDALGG